MPRLPGRRMSLISAEGLSVRLDGREVLRDIDVTLEPGEIVTIVGPNGSGKTTLLRALLGAVRPAAGRLTQAPDLRVGYLPQRLHIDPSLPLTVRGILNLPHRVSNEEARRVLAQTGADGLEARQVSALSGGQLQRVLLARALLAQPQVLMLDEPTTGLDQPGAAAFYRLIEKIARDHGCAVLMVSHELHVVMGASDRVICVNGHICCAGTPEQVSSAPEYRAMFGPGTGGALALYRHDHDHHHDDCGHNHDANLVPFPGKTNKTKDTPC